ncbi:MAG: hypothetical protein AAGM22_16340, partial [Acidobacteriota bacterium]
APALRPTPLDSGTYSQPSRGSKLALAAVAILVLGAIGFFATRLLLSGRQSEPTTVASTSAGETGAARSAGATTPGEPAPPTEAGSADSAAGSTSAADPSEAASGTDTSLESPVVGLGDPGAPAPRTPPPSAAPERTTPPPSTRSAGAQNPDRGTERTRPRTSNPATRTPPPRAVAPEPVAPRPTTPQPAAPETATPGPAAEEPAAGPSSAESAFDTAARGAYRELTSGLRFRFDVEPENTLVKIQGRGERSIVQGQVSRFEAGEDDARDLELPAAGDYLITLVHPGHGEIVYFVRAAASGPTQTIRLSMATASRRGQSSGGADGTVRVSRGVSFTGQPADAVVFVDGERRGAASEWSGEGRNRLARTRNSMKLDRGRHQIRIEAPGYKTFEVQVVVGPSARQRYFQIAYRLEKSQ